MIASLLSLAIATQKPELASMTAIDASLFKNGYGMVTYEVKVPASGEVFVKEPPQATLGTLWFYTEKGAKISDIVMTTVADEKSVTVTAQSLIEVLQLNKGKVATLTITKMDGTGVEDLTVKIVEANQNLLVYEAEGKRIAVQPQYVRAVTMADTVYTRTDKQTEKVPALRVHATPNSSLFLFALQQGLTWSPAYNVDITDKAELTLTAKATIVNDLFDLKLKEARLVSGFPNIAFLGQPDPLTLLARLQNLAGSASLGGGGGGFANRMDTQRAYAPAASEADFAGSFNVNDLAGFQAEDLYFYQLPNVELKNGERGYYMTFQSKSKYEHVYTLDIPAGERPDSRYAPVPPERTNTWHKLKFLNTSGRPLTTAPALISQNGQMLAQETMTYVPTGAEIKLPITQALDIASILTEEETGIERGTIKDRNGNPVYDTVTVEGSLELTNFKKDTVHMEVSKEIVGEVVSSGNAGKSTKSVRSRSDANPLSTIKWDLNLDKGQKLTLKYTYTVYVQSRGF